MPRPRWALLLACLLLAPSALLLPGCGDDPAGPGPGGDDVLELVFATEELQLLGGIVTELGLDVVLRTEPDLTLFAPTDEALLNLGPEMLARLNNPNNADVLRKLVRRHLVRGRFRAADLTDGAVLTPLEGPPLAVRVEGEAITVGGALVTEADFAAGNGVVHQIDEVVRDHLTLSERLRVTPLIATFANALATADLTSLVASGEPYTLLIPINSGFADLGTAELQYLLATPNRGVLQKVLRHHILPGRVQADQFTDGAALAPLGGFPLSVEVDEENIVYVGGARVIVPQIETSNGLIYLLDSVVLGHLTLAERMQIAPRLTTSYAILRDAGLLSRLNGSDPYSLFSATDAAWAPLGLPLLDALQDRPDLLLKTAQHQIVPGIVERDALFQEGTLTTLGGYDLPVRIRSEVGGPQVLVGDRGVVDFPPLEATGGLLYEIAPFNIPPDVDLEERAVFAGLYRFLNLIVRGNLTSTLESEGPFTVFAPIDDVLAANPIPDGSIPSVMRYHIVPGSYEVGDLPPVIQDSLFFLLPTLQGSDIKVYPTNRGVQLNCTEEDVFDPETGQVVGVDLVDCAPLTLVNIRARNGVIHLLNGVLRP
jgi:uncharacterized surface protein with fasciclin (FAS1) repeats